MEQRILDTAMRFAPVVPPNPYSNIDALEYEDHLAPRRSRDSAQERLFFLFVVMIEHFVSGIIDAVDIGESDEPDILLNADLSNEDEVKARRSLNAKRGDVRNFMGLNTPLVSNYVLDLVAAYQV